MRDALESIRTCPLPRACSTCRPPTTRASMNARASSSRSKAASGCTSRACKARLACSQGARKRRPRHATRSFRPARRIVPGAAGTPKQSQGSCSMDSSIALILLQDGVVNGAIYALLGMALVLVFAVTRVIFIPQGEFVAFGALTLAMLVDGKVPGTAICCPCWSRWRWKCCAPCCAPCTRNAAGLPKAFVACLVLPLALLWLTLCRARHVAVAEHAADAGAGHSDGPDGLSHRLSAAGRSHRAGAADRVGGRALRADRPGPGVLRRRRLAHAGVRERPGGPGLHDLVGPEPVRGRDLRHPDRRPVAVLRQDAVRPRCAPPPSTVAARAWWASAPPCRAA